MTPADRAYTETHEWVSIDDDVATIGITEHAQQALGDITFVEMPSIGEELEQGSGCGVIESVKAASDLYAPIAGTVIEINSLLEDKPELVNQDPYEDGWLFKIGGVDESACDGMLDAEAYEKTLT